MPDRTLKSKDQKRSNKVSIVKFILSRGETNKLEISINLGISMPTVLQNIKELMEENIIEEIGSFQSTGGRKAKILSIVGNIKYSVGVDITLKHIRFVLLDLKGNLISTKRVGKAFVNSLDYYEYLKSELTLFLAKSCEDTGKILGVGIALPGIIDKENEVLIKSHILKLSNVSLKNISQMLPYEVKYENDANSAAKAELNLVHKNAVYLSLSNTVGGAIYINNSVYTGDNFRSAEFGHMMIEPNGRQCYCGKKGCIDTYISAQRLSEYSGDNLDEFFIKLTQQDAGAIKIWEEYLEYLAITITNLRMSFDCDIILGGYLGSYLEKYLPQLNRKVISYNLFENDTTYLKCGKYHQEASAIGIAMNFIDHYIESL